MKKLLVFILCLALISLACLDTGTAGVMSVFPGTATIEVTGTRTNGAVKIELVIETESPARSCAVVEAETAAHLRGEADPTSRILTHLLNGEVVQVIDKTDGEWWKVKRGGVIGFARSLYLRESECEAGDE